MIAELDTEYFYDCPRCGAHLWGLTYPHPVTGNRIETPGDDHDAGCPEIDATGPIEVLEVAPDGASRRVTL